MVNVLFADTNLIDFTSKVASINLNPLLTTTIKHRRLTTDSMELSTAITEQGHIEDLGVLSCIAVLEVVSITFHMFFFVLFFGFKDKIYLSFKLYQSSFFL